ncbi:MAG: hypothetical protein ACK49C_00485 [Ignavibacteria bacterium]
MRITKPKNGTMIDYGEVMIEGKLEPLPVLGLLLSIEKAADTKIGIVHEIASLFWKYGYILRK